MAKTPGLLKFAVETYQSKNILNLIPMFFPAVGKGPSVDFYSPPPPLLSP